MILKQSAILEQYANDIWSKLETMGENVRDAVNFYNDCDDKWDRQKYREHARVLEQEYLTLNSIYDDVMSRVRVMKKIEDNTISPYILKMIERLEVGDEVSFRFSRGNDSVSYYGEVTKIVGLTAIVKNISEMEFFESLAYPQVMDINLERVWFYTITKKDGTEYYG